MRKWMRTGLALTLTMLLLVSPLSTVLTSAEPYAQRLPSAGNNLLVDGDFENPNTVEWFLSEKVTIDASAKSPVNGGNYGLRLPWAEFDTKCECEFSQVALAPNTTYVVKAD